jgi:hypothetical protein
MHLSRTQSYYHSFTIPTFIPTLKLHAERSWISYFWSVLRASTPIPTPAGKSSVVHTVTYYATTRTILSTYMVLRFGVLRRGRLPGRIRVPAESSQRLRSYGLFMKLPYFSIHTISRMARTLWQDISLLSGSCSALDQSERLDGPPPPIPVPLTPFLRHPEVANRLKECRQKTLEQHLSI